MILLVTFIVSACSIIYELGFSYIISILYGNTTETYSTTIGLFLFFLGIGAFIYEYIKIDNKKLFYIVEFLLSFIGLSTIILLYIFYIEIDNNILSLLLSYLILVIIALLSGMELPLLINLRKDKSFSKVLSIDYFGALIGTLIYAYYLLPTFNIINSIIFTSLLNLFSILLLSIYYKDKYIIKLSIFILFIYISILNIIDIENQVRKYYTEEKIIKINMKEYNNQTKETKVKINNYFDTKYQEMIDANITLYPLNRKPYNMRCIYLNGDPQICSNWVKEYHTFLVNIPLIMFPKNRNLNVLILGGGDLVAVDYLLKDKRVKRIDLIDIDKQFVSFSKEKLNIFNNSSFNDKRLNVIYDDAFKYIINRKENYKYDIVINDLPIITNEHLLPLISIEFYIKLYKIMSDKSILSTIYRSNNIKEEIDIFSCSGFDKILITNGFNIDKNFIKYSDQFFYLSKNKEFKIYNNNIINNKIYKNSIQYNLKCTNKSSLNSIFKLDKNLIIKDRF